MNLSLSLNVSSQVYWSGKRHYYVGLIVCGRLLSLEWRHSLPGVRSKMGLFLNNQRIGGAK